MGVLIGIITSVKGQLIKFYPQMHLFFELAFWFLGIFPTHEQNDICTRIFTAVLFVIAELETT